MKNKAANSRLILDSLNQPNSIHHRSFFPAFFIIWILLGLGWFLFFTFNKNSTLKKRLLPVFIIGTGILFIGFVTVMTHQLKPLLFLVPTTALICYLNLRNINICDSCGCTVYSTVHFMKAAYCSKCGAKLK